MRRCVLCLCVVCVSLGMARASWAQSTVCTDPVDPSMVASNPVGVAAILPEFDVLTSAGDVKVPSYDLGWVVPGAPEPIQAIGQIPRASWMFVSAGCYQTTLPPLTGVPIGIPFMLALRAVGAPGLGVSQWTLSDHPFGVDPSPLAPGALRTFP